MSRSITRIHPDLPVCWEDTDTLRFGFDCAEARVRSPSAGVQRLIGSLRTGINVDRLTQEALGVGATPQEARKLIEALAPALQCTPATAITPTTTENARSAELSFGQLRVRLCDGDHPVEGLQEAVTASGLSAAEQTSSPDLVVFVERFFEPLERAQRWLIAAQPHLLVRFTDRAVLVGPLILPEGNPCHTCDALTEISRDGAIPALAAQLHDSAPSSETAAGTHMAAAWIAVWARAWIAGDSAVHKTRVRIPMSLGRVSGAVTLHTVAPHPECACTAFSSQSPLPL